MSRSRAIIVGAALAVIGAACRQDQPVSDPPKTPPNSPIPDIDRKDDDPKAPPKLPDLGDAG